MPQQNVWSAMQDAFLNDLAQREVKRQQEEQLARDLEDRAQKRQLVDLQMAGERQRQGFAADTASREAEESNYQKGLRPLKEREIQQALTKGDQDIAEGTRKADLASKLDPLAVTSAQQGVDLNAQRLADEKRAASIANQRQALIAKYAAAPAGSPERANILDQISVLDGQLPPSARPMTAATAAENVPVEVQKMIAGIISAPGMTADNARRAVQMYMPALQEHYTFDPNAVYNMVDKAFGKQGTPSLADQLMSGDTGSGKMTDDQIQAILQRVDQANQPREAAPQDIPPAVKAALDQLGAAYTPGNIAAVTAKLQGGAAQPAQAPQLGAPGSVVFDPNAPLPVIPVNAGPRPTTPPSMADLLRAFMASQRGTVSQIGR
jgi:hypothetical protein